MSNYSRGRDLEYAVKHKLEDLGYKCIRTAGSHSPLDVLAARKGERLGIQAKLGGSISSKEWNELWEWCDAYEFQPLIVERDRGLKFHLVTGRKLERGKYPWTLWEPQET